MKENNPKKRNKAKSSGILLALTEEQSGFTLLELMIVVGVIMILASFGAVAAHHTRERARLSLLYTDIRTAKSAAQRFEQDVGFYPLDCGAGVDPGLVDKYGWQEGSHSGAWDLANAEGLLDGWNGPYMEKWGRNPWGGVYEWDNYPPGYSYMGITGGAVYLSLKAKSGAGTLGLPPSRLEDVLEKAGVDESPIQNFVTVRMGRYPAAGPGK
jgi:general secretion pathway protein G